MQIFLPLAFTANSFPNFLSSKFTKSSDKFRGGRRLATTKKADECAPRRRREETEM